VTVHHEIHVGTSKVIAHSRIAKLLFSLVSIACVAFLLVSLISKVRHALQQHPEMPPIITVFLPDPTRFSENAFYQDGAVQKRGFDKAQQDAEGLPNRLKVDFYFMKKEDTAEATFGAMKDLYENKGTTYFVMTMSGKVGGVQKYFEDWHSACIREGKREPILIATVASAPNLANASSGILRWYVRSEEESSLLAEYLRWKEGITKAAVFYICRTAGQSDDRYGLRGAELFQRRFMSLGGSHPEAFNVTAETARSTVKSFLAANNERQASTPMGVFVVGYGDMVRETINELVTQGFNGPIVCTSTLTEAEWQPHDGTADNRIFTVMPRRIDAHDRLRGDDRNVVFLFSKTTLARVLDLTARVADSRRFIENWKTDGSHPDFDQAHLANGDIIVYLDVVGSDQWR